MPSTSLAVEGSERTFNCVEVVPDAGATVAVGGGGSGVSEGRGVVEGGSVTEIMSGGVGVGKSFRTLTLQPAARKLRMTRIVSVSFEGTERFYCITRNRLAAV